jgi:ABC-2 type transport system permease protein
MSDALLLARQVQVENKAFWRNPSAAFFTFALPVLFLVIFTSVFDFEALAPGGLLLDTKRYYVPSTLTFSVFTACYTNIAMGVATARDAGILKRVRGTPLPSSLFVLGKVVHSLAIMALLVVVTLGFAAVAYDVNVPSKTLGPLLVTIAIGAATFCALGLAITALIPNANAAPAIMNGVTLPLMMVSGTFVPIESAPAWLKVVADVFPIRHFVDALFAGYGLNLDAPDGWLWGDLAVIALWGIGGAIAAIRWFRWE